MKTLKKIKEWLKQLKEDLEKESVSQMKTSDKLPCCSRPIEPTNTKKIRNKGNGFRDAHANV